MSRLGRVTPSAGRDVIDRKTCYLSLLAQAAVWLLELRVSQHFSTFLYILRLICSVHGYPARRAASTANPNDRGAWSVRGKWSWGVAPGDFATVPFRCSAVPLLFLPTPGLTGNDLRRIVRLELLPDGCSARDGGQESRPPGIATPVPAIASEPHDDPGRAPGP